MIRRALASVIGLTLTAAPALAADAPAQPTPEAIAKLHEYATCLVTKRPKIVRETLAMDFRDDDYDKAIRDVAGPGNSCPPEGELRFAPILIAGAMAERAYEVDFAGRAAHDILPADWTSRPVEARSNSEYAALCVVQRQPDAVQALLATPVASPAEKAAFGPLLEALPKCMKPKTQLALNRPYYRAILSLAMYRAARFFSTADTGRSG